MFLSFLLCCVVLRCVHKWSTNLQDDVVVVVAAVSHRRLVVRSSLIPVKAAGCPGVLPLNQKKILLKNILLMEDASHNFKVNCRN